MKISIEYNNQNTEIERPDHNYGSNLGTFQEIASLAFKAVGLDLVGEIKEIKDHDDRIL